MTKIKPDKARAILTETSKGLVIEIPSKKNIFLILFVAAWLVAWAVGEVMVPSNMFHGDNPWSVLLFVGAWLVAWTVGGCFVIYIWLWNVAGKEKIVASDMGLSIKRELFGFGREKEYEISSISNLRVSPQPYNPFNFSSGLQAYGIGGGIIAFDYGARTYRFGSSLDEAEANQIISSIKQRGKF
jgi:hypothetical protein